MKKLTPEEQAIIINKGTEAPFSGKYWNNNKNGQYFCKQCGAKLFDSKDQFASECGWPSFDDEISAAVKKIPDSDGRRTEIICSNCCGHLGHIFNGEGFTAKNMRYCVNSIALDFVEEKFADQSLQSNIETAYFAGGCFWGVEYFFKKIKGLKSVTSGYMGGAFPHPTYEQVCLGKTGHVETVRIVFDTNITNFKTLGQLFFEIHNPEELNRQGPDIGLQYASVIFYTSANQKIIAEELIKILENKNYQIATKLNPATQFWPAELYHQNYYGKNGKKPYCHLYTKRF